MNDINPRKLSQIIATSECLVKKNEVDSSMKIMADKVEAKLGHMNLIILPIMSGGLVPAGLFLRYFNSNCELDYIQISRYGNKTKGGKLNWHQRPHKSIKGRNILIIDDILDQGITLATAISECESLGPKSIHTAVMVKKDISQRKGIQDSDFQAMTLPDKYLFGSGLDYHGYFRNLDGIYSLNSNQEIQKS